MSSLVDMLSKDVTECLVDVKDYYSKRSTYRIAKAYSHRAQVSLWTFKFESHRKIIQTALALYLSLGAVSVDTDKRLAFAFNLFPQLDPFQEDRLDTTQPVDNSTVLLTQDTTTETDRKSTQSSYVTARETMNSFSTSSLSRDQHRTLYSVASSRTAETDYGLYYRRMALSQITGDSTGGWVELSWGSELPSEVGEQSSSITNAG
ncbi:hypothetical protein CVT25_003572 [Psilocybe cyanescens]|uniref:Uncharacterized protein n=1 Tax=Psilocybe cyanescens TaxID=93625 RepID=A0A409WNZ1_PSICY|nr:hypothetical protein CVT25_003572 [Psilocybe cyanescens]